MTAFYYTALREVMSGHTVDTAYTFDAPLASLQKMPKTVKRTYTTMNGTNETVVQYREVKYTATSIIEDGAAADQWAEFLNSIDGGEAFQVDIAGTVASPDNIQSAIIEGDFRQNFIPGSNAYQFSFSFKVI